MATRKASQLALDALAPLLPELFGGSADLTGSNLTNFKGCVTAGRDQPGNHLSWGVREFGMAAALNGMALHGGFIPYGGTFLTFSDYSRNAIRMAALMKLRVIHVFTHDSIGLGEDGPTHQSVEHVPSLRLIPQLDVWRPADTLETAVAWSQRAAARTTAPVRWPCRARPCRCWRSRRRRPTSRAAATCCATRPTRAPCSSAPAPSCTWRCRRRSAWPRQGMPVRVVSMPSTSVFDRQPRDWQDSVLPPQLPAVAVEAAHPDFWRKYVGRSGAVVGIASFGESAPAPALYAHFGITADAVVRCRAQGAGMTGVDRRCAHCCSTWTAR